MKNYNMILTQKQEKHFVNTFCRFDFKMFISLNSLSRDALDIGAHTYFNNE